ncbi:MAG: PilX N-terminal domain-containing pilus assembly protein [Roseateles sp.]|uniref:PilX N-terminal domain-containing pilus assembly protein n=1 Tax=Roseateles sp. TaxID=1971397 RepID=UPI004036ED0B
MSAISRPRILAPQHGAATLVVVMVLFLVMAMLAAYANRTMMFEQRISSSYFRASVAQEAAEAGLEWGIAQLNGEAINGSCEPVPTGGTRFIDRYLSLSVADRAIRQSGAFVASTLVDCTRNGNGWTCRCPALGAWAAPAPAAGTAVTPSFGIRIQPLNDAALPSGAGTVLLKSLGCTQSVVSTCAGGELNSRAAQGAIVHEALVALVSAVRSPPAAPLVVKGDVTVTGTGLGLHNTDPRSAGSLYAIGGTVTGFNESRLSSVPGTSPSQARIAGDDTLRDSPDVFKMFMGATRARYLQHPSLRQVTCSGDCAATLAAAYAAGKRIIWVNGDMTIQSSQTLGSVSDPVVIIAGRDITLSGAFRLNGMLVAGRHVHWSNASGGSMIVGMLLAEGNVTTAGVMDIVYQPAIADQLRNRVGSFVRVPGGWTDDNVQ